MTEHLNGDHPEPIHAQPQPDFEQWQYPEPLDEDAPPLDTLENHTVPQPPADLFEPLTTVEEPPLTDEEAVNHLSAKTKELGEALDGAQIDTLTGLLLRGGLDSALKARFGVSHTDRQYQPEHDREIKPPRRVMIVNADVTELKVANETFKPSVGDQLLRKAATIFKDNFRESDLVARDGGDEFKAIVEISDTMSEEAAHELLELQLSRLKDKLSSPREYDEQGKPVDARLTYEKAKQAFAKNGTVDLKPLMRVAGAMGEIRPLTADERVLPENKGIINTYHKLIDETEDDLALEKTRLIKMGIALPRPTSVTE
jgi:diguanylate cyclase (GGDEF)-like protein